MNKLLLSNNISKEQEVMASKIKLIPNINISYFNNLIDILQK